jgi:predicted nucleic acid-binding protein
VIYLDTSAFVKLAWLEAETERLLEFLADAAGTLVSSSLLTVEARRAALRRDPRLLPRVDVLLTDVGRIAVTDAVIHNASRLPDPSLRSLDAIHLATAALVGSELISLVTYDARMAATAASLGLPVVAPGT